MLGLWQLAQRSSIFLASDPLAGMGEDGPGEIDFQDAADDFLALVEALVDLARHLPVPEPGQEARIEAVVAVQLGLLRSHLLKNLSHKDVLAVMKEAQTPTLNPA